MNIPELINDFLARYGIGSRRSPVPAVAVIRLHGAIGIGGFGRRGLSLAALEPLIKRAFSRKVRAVCLLINSPGGSAVQSAQIANLIRTYSQDKKMPVFAFTEDVAASGGYWLALAADEIYADPMSVIGSIGVISASFGFQDLMAKIGVERRVHTQGENKSLLDPFKPENPDDVRRLKDIQADIHHQFKSAVRQRRGERLVARDETVFTGDIWAGARALELGLIDGLGDMRTIMRRRYGPDVRFMMVERPAGWLQRNFGRFMPGGGASVDSFGMGVGFAGDMLAAVEERALWARFGL
ncbi:MAG: S49 family peptidase [Rhodospirillaceae bacterium]|nr:S49 family peptidase [Rhodospirillaceae bacterium]